MKKTILATSVAVALAAFPVVGAVAADPTPITDTINVTVGETCTFESSNEGGKTYTLSMGVNDLKTTSTSSAFTAVCNNATGFSVSATPTDITGTGETIAYSVDNPTAGSGTWTATVAEDSANLPATGAVLMSVGGVTTGVTKTVSYTVSTHANQAKGSYSGTIEYALTQN